MSLLSYLNRIVSDRRLAEDLAGNEPTLPPAPAGIVTTPPKRAKGSGAGFANVGLYPSAPTYLNQVSGSTSQWFQYSATTPPGFAGVETPPPQTSIGGPEVGGSEVGGSGGQYNLQYPNTSIVIPGGS